MTIKKKTRKRENEKTVGLSSLRIETRKREGRTRVSIRLRLLNPRIKPSHSSFFILHSSFFIFLLILLLGTLPCLGQETNEGNNWEYKEPDAPPPPNLFWISLRMIFALFVVVALIFLFVFILKRINPRRGMGDNQRPVQLLFQEPLGQKRSICLVKVLDSVLVLGVTNTNISYLSTLENDEALLFNEILSADYSNGLSGLGKRFAKSFANPFNPFNKSVDSKRE